MDRPRIVIIGAGFAGYHAARRLGRLMRGRAEIVLINPANYFLYLPLLPEVATGILDPRRISVSLTAALRGVRLVPGKVDGIDLDQRRVSYVDPEGVRGELGYTHLLITVGSVNKLLPIPGVAEHAHGFRGIAEALYVRDHIIRQVELADATDDADERIARLTFVVVGAGYTGTELAAQGVLFTRALMRKHPRLASETAHWMLLDIADRVLPELDTRLSRASDRVLRRRGVEVRMGTSVQEATHGGVQLTDGSSMPTRSLMWCVGVRPDPVVAGLGLKAERGRLVVDEYLTVPDRPEVFAAGDAAAVPDLTRPGEVTAMTAQHAERQGKLAARNIAAAFGIGTKQAYKHRDLGFLVDLGGVQAAANPLGIPLSGPPAKVVTRGYHLLTLPGNRIRVASDWFLDAILSRQSMELGLVRSSAVPLETTTPIPGPPGH